MTITTCLNTPFSVNKIFGHFTTLVRNNDIPLRIAPHYMDKPQVKIVAIFKNSIINCQVMFLENRITVSVFCQSNKPVYTVF